MEREIVSEREAVRREFIHSTTLFPPNQLDGFIRDADALISSFVEKNSQELLEGAQRVSPSRIQRAPLGNRVRVETVVRLSIDGVRLTPNCSVVLGFLSFPIVSEPQKHSNHQLLLACNGKDTVKNLRALFQLLSSFLKPSYTVHYQIGKKDVQFDLELVVGGDLCFLTKFLAPDKDIHHCPYCSLCRTNRKKVSMKEELLHEEIETSHCDQNSTWLMDRVPRVICTLHLRTRLAEWVLRADTECCSILSRKQSIGT